MDVGATSEIVEVSYNAVVISMIEKNEFNAADYNNDGSVNIQDIVQLIGIILGSIDPTNAQEAAADVNGDSNINIQDIVIIM